MKGSYLRLLRNSLMAAQLRTVRQLGDPILRRVAQPVDRIDDSLLALINDLIWTAEKTKGVGIAAPQVGVSQRVVIVASRPNLRYPHAPLMEPTALINPEIVARGDRRSEGWEGCLSVPDQRGPVWRHDEVEVCYLTPAGEIRQAVFTGFVARVLQHEYDHLEGVVFVDRVTDPQRLLSEADYFAQLTPAPAK